MRSTETAGSADWSSQATCVASAVVTAGPATGRAGAGAALFGVAGVDSASLGRIGTGADSDIEHFVVVQQLIGAGGGAFFAAQQLPEARLAHATIGTRVTSAAMTANAASLRISMYRELR